MTREETVLLTRYVKACCPQQAIDRYTPDAWHDLLGDLDAAEARAATAAVASRQPFVAPCEILAEAGRQRRAALGRARRAQLDAQTPRTAICPGDAERSQRLTREQINAVFAGIADRAGHAIVPPPPPPARDTTAGIEDERRRQLAALEAMMETEASR